MSRFTLLSTELHFAAVRQHGSSVVLDAGCGDGVSVSDHISPASVIGIDGYVPACHTAFGKGIAVICAELERCWPVRPASIDVVSANQVIEHLADPDIFAEECYRILRPGGIAVLSTENLAAWPNIAALLFGQEPFSNAYSKRFWLGNRFSRRRGRMPEEAAAYPHRSVGSYRAIIELFEQYGFQHVDSFGVHMLPLPAPLLRRLRHVDARHSMYVTFVLRKAS